MAIEKSLLRTNSTKKYKRSRADASSRRYADSSAIANKIRGKQVVRISVGMHANKSLDRINRTKFGIQSTAAKQLNTNNSSILNS
jgi:hypothetical protein